VRRTSTASRVLIGLLLAVSAVSAGDTAPDYVSELLPNGLRVSILPDPSSPLVATQVWYHVGAVNEDERSRGLAHLFEHMMFGRTLQRGERDYWQHHHRNGGSNNAYTSADETVYVSQVPPGAHLQVLEMEADRMRNLVIDDETLENEKKIVTEELRMRTENDPFVRVLVAAQQAVLGEHPYAFDPGGSKEDVAAATVESCREFYDSFYRPNNAHLVIVGPVDPEETLEEVRSRFGPIPSGGKTPGDVAPLVGWTYPREVVLEEDLPPVETAILAFPLPPADAGEHWTLQVMAQLLSWGEVVPYREEMVTRRRKAIEAGTQFLFFRRGGAAILYSATLPYRRKKTAFRLMNEARQELSGLDWLNEESLAGAKRTLRARELNAAYFAGTRGGAIGMSQWWFGDGSLALERSSRIEAVTLEQVADAYREYIGEADPVRLYIKPERVPALVRLFGWVYPLVSR
jgi:predicted Zn-dependent peptidase